jgi:hypothetical protein
MLLLDGNRFVARCAASTTYFTRRWWLEES